LTMFSGAWNLTMGLALTELAFGLALRSRPSAGVAALTVALAWCAVQCDSRMIAGGLVVSGALLAAPLMEGNRAARHRLLWIAATVIAVLQIPHAVYKISPKDDTATSSSIVQFRMPEYGVLVDAARKMAKRPQPLRAIHIGFSTPPPGAAEFLYTILGGRIDAASPWVGIITANGDVSYERLSPGQ
jgi:hypothetical protein